MTNHCQISCWSSDGMSWKVMARWASMALRRNGAADRPMFSRTNEPPPGALVEHRDAFRVDARADAFEVGLERLVEVEAADVVLQHDVDVDARPGADHHRIDGQPPRRPNSESAWSRREICSLRRPTKSPSVNSSTTRSERSDGLPLVVAAVEAILVVERLVDVLERGRRCRCPRETRRRRAARAERSAPTARRSARRSTTGAPAAAPWCRRRTGPPRFARRQDLLGVEGRAPRAPRSPAAKDRGRGPTSRRRRR